MGRKKNPRRRRKKRKKARAGRLGAELKHNLGANNHGAKLGAKIHGAELVAMSASTPPRWP